MGTATSERIADTFSGTPAMMHWHVMLEDASLKGTDRRLLWSLQPRAAEPRWNGTRNVGALTGVNVGTMNHFGSSLDQTVRCFSALPKVTSFCVSLLRSPKPDHGPQGVECRGRLFVQGILGTDFDWSSSAIHEVASCTASPSPERASTAEEGEAESSFGAAAEGGTHHSGELDEGVVCARWFVARGASFAEPIRVTSRSSFGSSGEDCEAGDGNYSSGARRFNGEISVGGSFADSEVDTSGERLDSCLQFIERASKMLQLSEVDLAPVLQKKARVEDELAQARQNLEVFARRGIRDSSRTPLLLRMPAAKWSNSVRRLQS